MTEIPLCPASGPADDVWSCMCDLFCSDDSWAGRLGADWLYLLILTAAQHQLQLSPGSHLLLGNLCWDTNGASAQQLQTAAAISRCSQAFILRPVEHYVACTLNGSHH